MSMNIKKFIITVFAAMLLAFPVYSSGLPMYPSEFSAQWVFSISNSLVTSKVVYGIHVSSGGNFSGAAPVYNYWYRPSGNNPRKVTYFENEKMYGIQSQKLIDPKTVKLILKAYDDMPIIVRRSGSKIMAYVNFDGKEYQLKSVDVKAEKGLVGIKVKSVHLILYDGSREVVRKIR